MIKRLKQAGIMMAAAAAAVLTTVSCSGGKQGADDSEPEVYVSIAADANFLRFADRDSITWYLEKCNESGFNHVVLDVKPNYGMVLYRSEQLPYLDFIEGITPEPLGRDWDYLQYFIDECHRLGMRLTASFSVMPCGSPYWQRGLCYRDSMYNDWLCVEYLSDGTYRDIRKSRKAAAFLNPARPEVKEYELGLIMELVRKYDIDGFSLDYCRYPDADCDFSDFTRDEFAKYLAQFGETLDEWPADVFTFDADGNRIDGKHINRWWAWRAGVVSDFVRTAADSIHSVKPDVDVEYWAATWIHALNASGQNWASPRSPWVQAYAYATPEYQAAGFAPYIDVFAAGAYLERVHGADDNESIEFAYNRADTLLRGDCKLVGSLYAINHDNDPENPNNMYEAATMSLEKTGNLRVFDISQIHKLGHWETIRRALDDYKARQSAK